MKEVLFIGAHPDDVEGGAGVLIQKVKDLGYNPVVRVLTMGTNEVLMDEMANSMRILGVKDWMDVDFPARALWLNRTAVLQDIVDWIDRIRPVAVVSNSALDKHQDHQVVGEEVTRAFYGNIYQFPIPHNQPIGMNLNTYLPASESEVKLKLSALSCYKSQEFRTWTSTDVYEAFMKVAGATIKQPYAEAFICVRHILNGGDTL